MSYGNHALGDDGPQLPSGAIYIDPADRFELIIGSAYDAYRQPASVSALAQQKLEAGQYLIAGTPILINGIMPDGTRNFTADPSEAWSYVDLNSGNVVPESTVTAWIAANASAAAANPTAPPIQIQQSLTAPPVHQVAGYTFDDSGWLYQTTAGLLSKTGSRLAPEDYQSLLSVGTLAAKPATAAEGANYVPQYWPGEPPLQGRGPWYVAPAVSSSSSSSGSSSSSSGSGTGESGPSSVPDVLTVPATPLTDPTLPSAPTVATATGTGTNTGLIVGLAIGLAALLFGRKKS